MELQPLLLGMDWMDPNWLLDRFGGELFWLSLALIFVECGLFFPFLPGDSLLFDGLQSLTAIQRKALVLHDWLDLPVDEVADIIGISAEQVLTHAARGRSALNFLLPESA